MRTGLATEEKDSVEIGIAAIGSRHWAFVASADRKVATKPLAESYAPPTLEGVVEELSVS